MGSVYHINAHFVQQFTGVYGYGYNIGAITRSIVYRLGWLLETLQLKEQEPHLLNWAYRSQSKCFMFIRTYNIHIATHASMKYYNVDITKCMHGSPDIHIRVVQV